MITSDLWRGNRYAVLGLARSGRATVDALLASGAEVVAWDGNAETVEEVRSSRAKALPSDAAASRDNFSPREGTSTSLGTNGLSLQDPLTLDLTNFTAVIVSPGVPLNRHPIAAHAAKHGVPIIGDIELFTQARAVLPPHKVVGITGTNGKSTTTALVHHILTSADVPATMGGNIGLPILAQEPLPAGGVYVLELSSYQIDLTFTLDCDVAVLLNITPDHLDRYASFEAYAASKARLFEMQSRSNLAVIVGDDGPSQRLRSLYAGRLIPTAVGRWLSEGVCLCDDTEVRLLRSNKVTKDALFVDGGDIYGSQAEFPALQGPHNALNLVAAAAARYALFRQGLGGEIDTWLSGFDTYPGLPHRMERIRDLDGVLFVNDSKATNADSTAPALAAYPAVRWILGGQAKTRDLDACAPHFSHVRSAHTIGEAGALFADLLRPHMPVEECGTLDVAVTSAARVAEAGDTVLLSPAAASFDQFRNFEDRGDAFRRLVEAL